jgi:hypothetical protein
MVGGKSLRESMSRPGGGATATQRRRSSSISQVRAAATGDPDFLADKGETGFKGLIHNPKSLGLALFASLGGVLYGYVSSCRSRTRLAGISDRMLTSRTKVRASSVIRRATD